MAETEERALPSGKQPNFGTKKEPLLPSGQKPNFGDKKKKKDKKPAIPNGDKSLSKKTAMQQLTSQKGKKKDETYAGSSFHSSPAALNLPKPSFKKEEENASAANGGQRINPQYQSPVHMQNLSSQVSNILQGYMNFPNQQPQVNQPPHGNQSNNVSQSSHPIKPDQTAQSPSPPAHQHPNHFMQPQSAQQMPPYPFYQNVVGPPRYPVTMYPPQQGFIQQPGFAYNYSPNGYIQYQYPPNCPPVPSGQPQAPKEHKISFNDLLGSAK